MYIMVLEQVVILIMEVKAGSQARSPLQIVK